MRPNLHDLIKGRLGVVRKDLDEVVARLSDDLLPWAPREGMRTIAGQLLEIAGTEVQWQGIVRDEKDIPYQEAMVFKNSDSLAGLKEALRVTREQTLLFLDSLSEDELQETLVPFPEGWFEAMQQPAVPLYDAFHGIALHEWYHTGQLVSYLWARGDDPYQW